MGCSSAGDNVGRWDVEHMGSTGLFGCTDGLCCASVVGLLVMQHHRNGMRIRASANDENCVFTLEEWSLE